ncbi:MAG TPA: CheR family methyltransferase [Burkholderiales bacterium]|nr:CheR family methyltransferase [Burkholderiales bacterium]
MTEDPDRHFETLLGFLQRERGFDFTGYKRPSLMRRVMRRMQVVAIDDFEHYVEYLEVHPEEFVQLFNTILINVTSFFRDEAPWTFLRQEVLPELIAAKRAQDHLRVWSAGCATGQEAYSLAIAFAEAMGAAAFRERVKIYGTDADEEALNAARLASYPAKDLETVDPELVKRYFEASGGRLVFRPELRRAVIFGRHDILQDAPISRLDLLVCRNTLMYFNAETQQKIVQRFHFALNGEGKSYLFLGRAEMLLGHPNLFTPLDLKCRVFVKVPSLAPRVRPGAPVPAAEGANGPEVLRHERLRALSLDEAPVARIVVDANGALAIANQKARLTFSINPKDIGRQLQDLEIAYRPLELRVLVEQAYAERRALTQTSVERRFPDGERQYFDIVVAPLYDDSQTALGAGITFVDVTRFSRLSEELQHTREEIQTANEELQSSNEELETTNEELQSTNEELETMNEELQSTNEELQTVNEELRQRTDEMNQLNAFLESVFGGMRAAAVVVNQNLDVLVWNRRAEDLWGLRADEVQGRSLLNLDIGLPVRELREVVRPCLGGEGEHGEIVLDAINRRGKKIQCRITCSPLVSAAKKREGVILLMEEVEA